MNLRKKIVIRTIILLLQEDIDKRSHEYKMRKYQADLLDYPNDSKPERYAKIFKALEASGRIHGTTDEFSDVKVENFNQETLGKLREVYGPNLRFLSDNGKIYAIIPHYSEHVENVFVGKQPAGILDLKTMCKAAGNQKKVIKPPRRNK